MNHDGFDSLNKLFSKAARRHYQMLHDQLSEFDVFPGQPPLLRALAMRDGRSQKELAERLQIAPATLTVMLRRMEKYGLIRRRQDDADQRISRVYITERGLEAHAAVLGELGRIEARSFGNFSEEEKEQLRHLLLKMLTNLSTERST